MVKTCFPGDSVWSYIMERHLVFGSRAPDDNSQQHWGWILWLSDVGMSFRSDVPSASSSWGRGFEKLMKTFLAELLKRDPV